MGESGQARLRLIELERLPPTEERMAEWRQLHRVIWPSLGLGERVAARRRQLGLSQVELAGRVGRSESWVSQVERGVRAVDRVPVRAALAEALEVRLEELVPGVEINELGLEKVKVIVELLLRGGPTVDVVLGQLTSDLVVREVVRELLALVPPDADV